jgi:hypothetical protein
MVAEKQGRISTEAKPSTRAVFFTRVEALQFGYDSWSA